MTKTDVTTTLAVYDAIHESIRLHRPLAIIYATNGTEIKERVIKPVSIDVGKRGSDLIIAHDSLRDGVISLRVDRVVAISGQVQTRY